MLEETNHIDESLIIAYLAGKPLSADQVAHVDQWLERPGNLTKARELYKQWELTQLASSATVDKDRAYAATMTRIKAQKPTQIKMFPWLVAASVLIALFIGFTMYLFQDQQNDLTLKVTEEIIVSEEKREISLADGSLVSLNAHSTLRYEKNTWKESSREVFLEGQAFFEVVHKAQKPFVVVTRDARVQVLGTKFMVSTGDNVPTQVQVTEGSVQVTYLSSDKTVILKANEELAPSEPSDLKVQRGDVNQLYWKTGVMIFQGDSLGKVFATLASQFDQSIVSANEEILDCSITATFKKQSLETIIRVIETTHNLTSRVEDGTIVIEGDGCD